MPAEYEETISKTAAVLFPECVSSAAVGFEYVITFFVFCLAVVLAAKTQVSQLLAVFTYNLFDQIPRQCYIDYSVISL